MQFTRPAFGIEILLLTSVILAAITDVRSRRIPNWLTVSTLVPVRVTAPAAAGAARVATSAPVIAIDRNVDLN